MICGAADAKCVNDEEISWLDIWFGADGGLDPDENVIDGLNLLPTECGSWVDLKSGDGELNVPSLCEFIAFYHSMDLEKKKINWNGVRCNGYYKMANYLPLQDKRQMITIIIHINNSAHLKIGTRLVVLNIWKLGMLLLAEFKYCGTLGDDAMLLKNFNWLTSGLPLAMKAGFPPIYDFRPVCGITVCAMFELLDMRFCVVGYLSIDCFGDDW